MVNSKIRQKKKKSVVINNIKAKIIPAIEPHVPGAGRKNPI
jgi:hypothetical protein